MDGMLILSARGKTGRDAIAKLDLEARGEIRCTLGRGAGSVELAGGSE